MLNFIPGLRRKEVNPRFPVRAQDPFPGTLPNLGKDVAAVVARVSKDQDLELQPWMVETHPNSSDPTEPRGVSVISRQPRITYQFAIRTPNSPEKAYQELTTGVAQEWLSRSNKWLNDESGICGAFYSGDGSSLQPAQTDNALLEGWEPGQQVSVTFKWRTADPGIELWLFKTDRETGNTTPCLKGPTQLWNEIRKLHDGSGLLRESDINEL